jgi:hypothetical protein
MTIPIEIDRRTESTLRAHASRLKMEPKELAGELLRQVVANQALYVVLSQASTGEASGKAPLDSTWEQIAKTIFADGEQNPGGGDILQFGMFRGELGELSEEDFRGAEFAAGQKVNDA